MDSPQEINGYKIKKTLSSSDFRNTYLAKSKEDNKYYVLRQIDAKKAPKMEIEKFFNHIRIGRSIRHKNVIHVNKCFYIEDKQHVYCSVEEYATYGSLTKYFRKIKKSGNLSEIEAWNLII